MKKLISIKANQLAIEHGLEDNSCDFCGEESSLTNKIFTSSFDDCPIVQKCVMQICENCVKQLYKMIK